MSRYTGPVCKLCRREGMQLFLKGQRCFSDKCAVQKRNYPPGQHAQRRSKATDYGLRLREKQKLKRIYGNITEKQFRNYFSEAERRQGNTGDVLVQLLERRLDSVVISGGLALSRTHARHLVNHGHFKVNGRRVDIASFQLRPGDVITLRDNDKTRKVVTEALEFNRSQTVPDWISVDRTAPSLTVSSLPTREHFTHPIQLQMIIELCSR
ncbi:30S ribosomal protein S4 [Planctomycetes bacterium Pla163]|uniref:Small ribosomal subunit protein uS4 n=1 Tax=Rohdeia mirabilis TaxID=2528008 RepID=A0A518D2R6_9BACT|nr:30S ribosomal protein S4 [Planctomycetes bacterium Pla163]